MTQHRIPTIEELNEELATVSTNSLDNESLEFFVCYRVIAYGVLHAVMELEQLNNNLEALRGPLDELRRRPVDGRKH